MEEEKGEEEDYFKFVSPLLFFIWKDICLLENLGNIYEYFLNIFLGGYFSFGYFLPFKHKKQKPFYVIPEVLKKPLWDFIQMIQEKFDLNSFSFEV